MPLDEKVLLGLITSLVEDIVKERVQTIPLPLNGKRGLRGPQGNSFVYEEHQSKIESLIAEETKKHSLKFSDLSAEEKSYLKGEPGPKGKNGRDGQDATTEQIKKVVEGIKDELKLKLSDLTDEEVQSLRVRGPRGQKGKSFSFEENRESISEVITSHINEIKEELKPEITDEVKQELKLKFSDLSEDDKEAIKLKFSDLSEEEINQLKVKGPRGQRGPKGFTGEDGLQGIQGPQGKDGKFGPMGLPGPMGLRGPQGLTGQNGNDAAEIVDIEIQQFKDKFYFVFYFSDGRILETDEIELPQVDLYKKSLGMGGAVVANPQSSPDNFSYSFIRQNEKIKIPVNQQMLVYGELTNDGEIINNGEIVVFETTPTTRPITAVTTDTSLNADYFNVLVDCATGDISLTLPNGASYDRKEFNIKKIDNTSNKVNIIGTVDGGTTTELVTQYESITLQHDGVNWWIL